MTDLDELLSEFEPICLHALEERAALLRRVDNKYALTPDQFEKLAGRLGADHQVLEIEGRRAFRYSTTYFDTADLRCFTDHVEGRVPRFKARTRLYEDSGECVFEVKLKRSEDETDKRQIEYSAEDRHRVTARAEECTRSALGKAGLEPPDDLSESLTSAFERVTLAARSGAERLTCDLGVRVVGPGGDTAQMRDRLVLVETKSEAGESPVDRELARMGLDPISLSKYRVGMSLVGRAKRFGPQPGGALFEN